MESEARRAAALVRSERVDFNAIEASTGSRVVMSAQEDLHSSGDEAPAPPAAADVPALGDRAAEDDEKTLIMGEVSDRECSSAETSEGEDSSGEDEDSDEGPAEPGPSQPVATPARAKAAVPALTGEKPSKRARSADEATWAGSAGLCFVCSICVVLLGRPW